MIKKLKAKFVLLAMTALVVLMVVVVAGMNVINYKSVVNESDEILSVLSKNRGVFPESAGKPGNPLPPRFSPEMPFESRYFTVTVDANGTVTEINTRQIASVDKETAVEFAEEVLSVSRHKGFADDYRYIVYDDYNGVRISFLDCGRKLDSFRTFLYTSIGMSLLGLALVFVVVFVLAGKIIQPIAESYEKQKRFITDAGHEIKTPLTVIGANVDILEMELTEPSESLNDIRTQTKRLRNLTDDLIMLSRMEEAGEKMQMIGFPISEVVAEAAHPFENLAMSQGKEVICNIQPLLSFCGNDRAISELTSLLLDNAIKYSPEGGTIVFTLAKENRYISVSCTNTTAVPISDEQIKNVFERFYRTDSSRNSETGGHGIGLSIAKAIVNAHGGKIHATIKSGNLFEIKAIFPL